MYNSDSNHAPVASGIGSSSETANGGSAVQVILCTGLPSKKPGDSVHSGELNSALKMGMVLTRT